MCRCLRQHLQSVHVQKEIPMVGKLHQGFEPRSGSRHSYHLLNADCNDTSGISTPLKGMLSPFVGIFLFLWINTRAQALFLFSG